MSLRIALGFCFAILLPVTGVAQFQTDWEKVDQNRSNVANESGVEAGPFTSERRDARLPALFLSTNIVEYLPECADLPAEPEIVFDESQGLWVATSYEFGCFSVSIDGSVELDQSLTEEFGNTLPADLEIEFTFLDENGDGFSPYVEVSFAAFGIPYVMTFECSNPGRSICENEDGLTDLVRELRALTDFSAFTLDEAPDIRVEPTESLESGALPDTDFVYTKPGVLQASGSVGSVDRTVYFDFKSFPIEVGPDHGFLKAFIGSQLQDFTGLSPNSPGHYKRHRFHDNFCEPRRWKMPLCGSAKGHQGVDIRPNSPKKNQYYAVSVDDGVVTKVTKNTTVEVRYPNYSCRYLHLDGRSISAVGIVKNSKVKAGQRLGKVSNIMGGKPATSIHLHFDCRKNHPSYGSIHFPVYTSLVAAYRRAWAIDDGVQDGKLVRDDCREAADPSMQPPGEGTKAECAVPVAETPVADKCANVARVKLDVDTNGGRSIWYHNCSKMLLKIEGSPRSRQFVYLEPRAEIAQLVADDPVLFRGAISANGTMYRGDVKVYSATCGVQPFQADGPVAMSGRGVSVKGQPPECDGKSRSPQELVFEYLDDFKTAVATNSDN